MRGTSTLVAIAVLALSAAPAQAAEPERWAGYLDYAYVYSSAEPEPLRARLDRYAREAGMELGRYLVHAFEAREIDPRDEIAVRRRAVGHLLEYLATGAPEALDASVSAIRVLEDRLDRHENRYWYHYILAHRALEKGRPFDFVGELLDLWLRVVVPLERPYEALETLSLDASPHSGFAAALPYVYENVARLILVRSQRLGLDRDLDPLAALVRLLHDGRIGAHPNVIPLDASSRPYLERIVTRLNGPESDAGSFTFTLALFEAGKHHDRARELLATRGLEAETLEAMRVASGAYETALARAGTLQGECAVYTRVLRLLGELYAARQRLGVDPELDLSFGLEDAVEVYRALHAGLDGGFVELGYARAGRPAYLTALRGLWEEIQEATLNAASFYLTQAVEVPERADAHSRTAARLYTRYLALFHEFAAGAGREGVPESAYFAAHEAARGIGDAFLLYAPHATATEIDLAVQRYRAALHLFPFDREVWSALAAALERRGREAAYLDLVRPAADAVVRSRIVDAWIENGEPGAERIAVLRRAFADSLARLYLGYAQAEGLAELEASLRELQTERERLAARLETLRRSVGAEALPAAYAEDTRSEAGAALRRASAAEFAARNREIADTEAWLERVERQIAARSRTLPLYEATLAVDGFAAELRARRDHPLHALLRRLYEEGRP